MDCARLGVSNLLSDPFAIGVLELSRIWWLGIRVNEAGFVSRCLFRCCNPDESLTTERGRKIRVIQRRDRRVLFRI